MDSREWWRRSYGRPTEITSNSAPSELAIDVARSLRSSSRILDLGCGPAYDSAFLAAAGHWVVAADFIRPDEAWRAALQAGKGISFVLLDLRVRLPFKTETFNVVYARLSLHYHSTEMTHQIFAEIGRVLVAGGLFVFLCKSTKDRLFGQGVQVDDDMFRVNDKVYHFFDESLVRECLGDRFSIEECWTGPMETYPGELSHVIRVCARKR